MTSKTVIEKRLAFREQSLEHLYDAYLALVEGKVKSYQIDDRTLTRLDLSALAEEIRTTESEVDELEALLSGKHARKAYAVIPRDW